MASSLPEIVDDKSSHCIPFILSLLPANPTKPFIIGLNGVQGAGKTTLVSKLKDVLQKEGIETLVCSIDDLYLNHEDQLALAKAHPDNKLVQHRGEPGMFASYSSWELQALFCYRRGFWKVIWRRAHG